MAQGIWTVALSHCRHSSKIKDSSYFIMFMFLFFLLLLVVGCWLLVVVVGSFACRQHLGMPLQVPFRDRGAHLEKFRERIQSPGPTQI